jgi:hypothetical protein
VQCSTPFYVRNLSIADFGVCRGSGTNYSWKLRQEIQEGKEGEECVGSGRGWRGPGVWLQLGRWPLAGDPKGSRDSFLLNLGTSVNPP